MNQALRPIEPSRAAAIVVEGRPGPAPPPSPQATAIREAFVLPAIFLTVALLGGFRTLPGDAGFHFVPPPLTTLVLATLLSSVLIASRVLVPQRLMHTGRTAIENATGAAIVLCLFVASAQLFNLVTPETGLLRIAFNVVFFVLLANTAAAAPDRRRALRSVVIVFGSAFVLKFLVFAALQGPGGGVWFRVVSVLFDGVTAGSFAYRESGPITGYVAFFTVALFLAGLVLLPSGGPDRAPAGRQSEGSVQ